MLGLSNASKPHCCLQLGPQTLGLWDTCSEEPLCAQAVRPATPCHPPVGTARHSPGQCALASRAEGSSVMGKSSRRTENSKTICIWFPTHLILQLGSLPAASMAWTLLGRGDDKEGSGCSSRCSAGREGAALLGDSTQRAALTKGCFNRAQAVSPFCAISFQQWFPWLPHGFCLNVSVWPFPFPNH